MNVDISTALLEMFSILKPILILSGWLAFALAVIVMLVNMVIDAATGKGFRIGLK